MTVCRCIAFVIGQPFRLPSLRRALRYLRGSDQPRRPHRLGQHHERAAGWHQYWAKARQSEFPPE